MGKTIFIGSRKGGVGKTTTTANLGSGLAKRGKRVLLIDADSQHSLTVSLGLREPDRLSFTLASAMMRPNSVRAAECAALGVSIFSHDPRGKAASAYEAFTEEVLCCG